MSTSLVLANGSLLVNIDYKLELKDLYFPHIGSENQLNHYQNHFYVGLNNMLVDNIINHFDVTTDYQDGYMIGRSILKSKEYDLKIFLGDMVLYDRNIYLREIRLENNDKNLIEVKLLFQQNFALYESYFADTVFWHPLLNCIVHFKKNRYLACGFINGATEYSCAAKSDNQERGAFPSQNFLGLDSNPIANGNVCSLVAHRFLFNIDNKISKNDNLNYYFIIAGKTLKEIESHLNYLRNRFTSKALSNLKTKPDKQMNAVLKENLIKHFDETDTNKILKLYWRSLDIIKTQIDNGGAIIASNDGQYFKTDGTDSYSYVWPRDACEVIKTLVYMNEQDLSKNALNFLIKLIDSRGFIGHKYYPYATAYANLLGSSWQPWLSKNNNLIFPIQEDGTALFIQACEKYISKYNDQEFLYNNWNNKIKNALNFLLEYRFNLVNNGSQYNKFASDFKSLENSDLVLPSFDIWEQYYGVFTNTVVQVITAFDAGIKLASILEDIEFITKLQKAREQLYQALILKLFVNEQNIFAKGIYLKDKNILNSIEADASLVYIWKNNILNIIDDKVTSTMQYIINKLSVNTNIKGFARKEDDNYLKFDDNNNPWVISTLWISQYYHRINDMENAKQNLMWVVNHADSTGLLSEQINPITGFSLSVKPLTWSHSEFINTVNLYLGNKDLY